MPLCAATVHDDTISEHRAFHVRLCPETSGPAPDLHRMVQMSKKGITGHDEWVVTEALATALVALEQLQPNHQPRPHMEDIRRLLVAGCQPGTINLHLAQAKCRLFPN